MTDTTRRDFLTASVVAGVAVAAGRAFAAASSVAERDVTVETPDGTCDAAFLHPASGSHPGVLIWPAAFG